MTKSGKPTAPRALPTMEGGVEGQVIFALNKSPYSGFKLPTNTAGAVLIAEALRSVARQLPRHRNVGTTWSDTSEAYQSMVLQVASNPAADSDTQDTSQEPTTLTLDGAQVATLRQVLDSLVDLFQGHDPRFAVRLVSRKQLGLLPELHLASRNHGIRQRLAEWMLARVSTGDDVTRRRPSMKVIYSEIAKEFNVSVDVVLDVTGNGPQRTRG